MTASTAAPGPTASSSTTAFGKDTVTGFVATGAAHDTIDFSTAVFANFAAVHSHMAQSGANVIITLDAADTITLKGVTLASLTAADFTFHPGAAPAAPAAAAAAAWASPWRRGQFTLPSGLRRTGRCADRSRCARLDRLRAPIRGSLPTLP